MVKALAHACFVVSDLERSVGFYQGALGLAHAFDFTDKTGRRTGVYLCAGGRSFIELFEGAAAPKPIDGQSYRHICLEVDNIQTTVADLRAKGCTVSDPVLEKDNAYQAWTADPDGNAIEFHQYTSTSLQAPFLR